MSTIPDHYLPVIFLGLMGLAMLLYTLLDGFDLGTGLLMAGKPEKHRDKMIASIGPFWDANETWLVLGVGVMLVAFPVCLLYTSPSPRDQRGSRMPSSA